MRTSINLCLSYVEGHSAYMMIWWRCESFKLYFGEWKDEKQLRVHSHMWNTQWNLIPDNIHVSLTIYYFMLKFEIILL